MTELPIGPRETTESPSSEARRYSSFVAKTRLNEIDQYIFDAARQNLMALIGRIAAEAFEAGVASTRLGSVPEKIAFSAEHEVDSPGHFVYSTYLELAGDCGSSNQFLYRAQVKDYDLMLMKTPQGEIMASMISVEQNQVHVFASTEPYCWEVRSPGTQDDRLVELATLMRVAHWQDLGAVGYEK